MPSWQLGAKGSHPCTSASSGMLWAAYPVGEMPDPTDLPILPTFSRDTGLSSGLDMLVGVAGWTPIRGQTIHNQHSCAGLCRMTLTALTWETTNHEHTDMSQVVCTDGCSLSPSVPRKGPQTLGISDYHSPHGIYTTSISTVKCW